MKPHKLSESREIFAREFVRLGVASRAYRLAYKVKDTTKPDTIWQSASRLRADPKVAARIDELRAAAAEKAGITVETAIAKLDQHREGAIEDGAWGAANQAVMGQARIAGLLKDADESGSKGMNVTVIINSTDQGLL